LIAGLTPGVARVVRGRDRGACVDRDRSDEILAALGGARPTGSNHALGCRLLGALAEPNRRGLA
jgi:hypothetical protein